jgi:hypothetical protein
MLLFASLLLLFGCSKTNAPSAKKGASTSATAQELQGAAEFRETDAEQWRPLTNQHQFLENTAIRNVSTGTVRLVFGPAFGTNALLPNTEIRLKLAKSDGIGNSEFQLKVDNGTLVGGTMNLTASSKYEIMFSNGVLGVRSGPCSYLLNDQIAQVSTGTVVVVKIVRGAAKAATIPPGNQLDIPTMRVSATTAETNNSLSQLLQRP